MSVYQSTCLTSHTSIPTVDTHLPSNHLAIIQLTDQELFVRKIRVGLSKQVRVYVLIATLHCVVSDLGL